MKYTVYNEALVQQGFKVQRQNSKASLLYRAK